MSKTPETKTILKIENLKKAFDSNVVLDGINLSVPEGAIYSILGQSGVGKSVLIKCVMNILTADSGRIWFRNYNLTHLKQSQLSILNNFSYLFQESALFDSLSVFENIAFPLKEVLHVKDKNHIRSRVLELLQWVELHNIENLMPSELSGGMKKRVAFARTLAMEPTIMLFDEPTTGLDPNTGYTIMDLIRKTNKKLGVTCIIITHDVPASFRISDYLAFLDNGKIRASGTAEEVMNNQYPLLQKFIKHAFVEKDKKR